MKRFLGRDNLFRLILLLFCLYAGLYIYRTSFVIQGQRHFVLFDDAMISMEYAKNLANGHGLVWNVGEERVEGYSNLLWVLYMSIFHLLDISSSKICLFIQVSCALFLFINLFIVKGIARLVSNNSSFVFLASVFLTAFYLPLNTWSLQGNEVAILTLILSFSAFSALKCLKQKTFSPLLYLLLGISTLIRLDMSVPLLGFTIVLAVTDGKHRLKHIIWGSSILVFFILVQTIFRLTYYGEIFPNTYFLKLTGFPLLSRIWNGFFYFCNFVSKTNFIIFLIPFILLFTRPSRSILLIFPVVCLQFLYSIYVGGDAWEWWGGSNRYISIVMPLFFILFSRAFLSIHHFLSNLVSHKLADSALLTRSSKFALIFLFLCCFINFNLVDRDLFALEELFLIKAPLLVETNKNMVKRALLARETTKPQAKVAVVMAGIIPYFSNRNAIDLLGKNDKQIAREKMKPHNELGKSFFVSFYPGHMKYNYEYSIGVLKPDVIIQLWGERNKAKECIGQDYVSKRLKPWGGKEGLAYFRKDSPHVLWNKIEAIDDLWSTIYTGKDTTNNEAKKASSQ